jgi:L-fuculose-phosphate aldolase
MNDEKTDGLGEPSSEIKIHTAIYRHRKEINAVCHTHAAFATAFSICGIPFNEAILPEFVLSLGVVPLVKYATPGSERLALNLLEVVGKHDAFLLESHGTLALGRTLSEAFDRTEILEHYSRILFYAGQMRNPKLIPRAEVNHLLEIGGRRNLADTIISGEDDE